MEMENTWGTYKNFLALLHHTPARWYHRPIMNTGTQMAKEPSNAPGTPISVAPLVLRASPILAGFSVAFFAAVDRSLGSREGMVLLVAQFVLYAIGIYLCFPKKRRSRHN